MTDIHRILYFHMLQLYDLAFASTAVFVPIPWIDEATYGHEYHMPR